MAKTGRNRPKAASEAAPEDKLSPPEPDVTPDSAESDSETSDPLTALFNLDPDTAEHSVIQEYINSHLMRIVGGDELSTRYNVLILYDSVAIGRSDADGIYRAITEGTDEKPILLVMTSPGGDVAAAYLIAKLCREYTRESFQVVVPRQAKSAATLIACGADCIHMGSLSELGPIDPQFGQIPALALKNSVEHLATLAEEYPQASEMFASYLAKSLRVEALGFYERVAESAVQYAIRLLDKRAERGSKPSSQIANTLVYEYKDHGFVIDSIEAAEIFGEEVIATDTPEYRLGNTIYNALTFVEWFVGWRFSSDFAFTGSVDKGCSTSRRPND